MKKSSNIAKKSKKILICLDEKEYKIIQRKAELSGMNISQFVRSTCLLKHVKGFKKSDIEKSDLNLKEKTEFKYCDNIEDFWG